MLAEGTPKGNVMNRTAKSRLFLAVAGSLALTSVVPALAQVRVEGGGRAADANTRVGSSGYNDRVGGGTIVSPNQIVYGNVTGGKQFTGPVGERDPGAFTGPIPGRGFDRFIAGSSAAPQPYQPAISLDTAQPYYGSSRAVAPPLGTVREGFSGGYVGVPLNSDTLDLLSNQFSQGFLSVAAQPLGKSTVLGTRSLLAGGNEQGETIFQGPLEAASATTLYAGSPLYGVRPVPAGTALSDQDLLSEANGSALFQGPSDRFQVGNPEILRMQRELRQMSGQQPSDQPQQQNGGQNGADPRQQLPGRQSLDNPLESPENSSLNPQSRAGTALNQSALSNGTNTNQGIEQRFGRRVSPQLQSTQYDELRQRLERYQNPLWAQIQKSHEFEAQRAQAHGDQTGPIGVGGPAGGTTRPALPGSLPPSVLAQSALPTARGQFQPLRVTSLATGVRAKGLHDLLAGAEDLMRQDKFQSAIEKYDKAEQVAPNNGLIPLGRANAELGAGFYRQASGDLHQVFLRDPTLLMGQYDLNRMMRPERVQFIERELSGLAESDKNSETAPFLLAYIHYNTGNEAQAAKDLGEADKRAKGKDPLIDELRRVWKLPGAEPKPAQPQPGPAELNK